LAAMGGMPTHRPCAGEPLETTAGPAQDFLPFTAYYLRTFTLCPTLRIIFIIIAIKLSSFSKYY